MSITDRVYTALVVKGESLTAKQIASRYKAGNPYNSIYELRNEGYRIRLVETKNAAGYTHKKYRYVG